MPRNLNATKGIGYDIADVLDELGMCVEIQERVRPIIEKVDYDSNSQMTKPFNAEHFLMMMFTHASQIVAGDLLYAIAQNVHYRVMNCFPEIFEDTVIYKQGIVYKCNEVVSVYRPEEVRDPKTLRMQTGWIPIHVSVHSLVTDKLYGSELNTEMSFIQLDLRSRILYFPKKFEVLQKDRVVVMGGTSYEVTNIETNTFPGMNVIYLEEDTRR
jgi:hypothetical protein